MISISINIIIFTILLFLIIFDNNRKLYLSIIFFYIISYFTYTIVSNLSISIVSILISYQIYRIATVINTEKYLVIKFNNFKNSLPVKENINQNTINIHVYNEDRSNILFDEINREIANIEKLGMRSI
jgi:hypothetical protein